MIESVKVVIGANYGDEGKGLVSSCLAKEANDKGHRILTVLFNGGAQRAHTNIEGQVVHGLGAGLIYGSDTFYHEMFLVDPIAIWLEEAHVIIDPRCRVVVPCDVLSNREKEIKRGDKKHGTCGMGIYEACKRSADPTLRIEAKDLFTFPSVLLERLDTIEKIKDVKPDLVYNRENFFRAIVWMRSNCEIMSFQEVLKTNSYNTIIFEGGQGLMLDQLNRGCFPHLTPSSTGVRNITKELAGFNVVPDIYYVSRSYLTRHGAGPIENECRIDEINSNILDATNKPNFWQGALRYGYLNLSSLENRIKKDIADLNSPANINIVYTHLNYTHGKLRTSYEELSDIEKPSFVDRIYGSYNKEEIGVIL